MLGGKVMSAIALLYADQVRSGKRTIDQVPEKWREEVIEYLNSLNVNER